MNTHNTTMKFKPLEFVTNTLSSAAGAALRDAPGPTASGSDDNDEASASRNRVRFELPSSSSQSDDDSDDSFVLRKEDRSRRGNTTPRGSAGTGKANAHNNTPSPERNVTNKVSPPGGDSVDPSPPKTTIQDKETSPAKADDRCSKDGEVSTPSSGTATRTKKGAAPQIEQTKEGAATNAAKENHPGSVTPTPQKKTNASQPKKRRMSVYEQLGEEALAASERWREDAEAALRFKKQIHREVLRDIKEKEDDLKKIQDKLTRLQGTAADLEAQIQEDLQKKKSAFKMGNVLKRTTTRAAQRALKDREDAKTNLKAKDVLLKKALKDIKAAEKQKQSAAGAESAIANQQGKRGTKRKASAATPTKRRSRSTRLDDDDDDDNDESSVDNNELDDGSSADEDSDWEGASAPAATTVSAGGRRQTRVRSTTWACSRCTLENPRANQECGVCGESGPGTLP
jgi:hypothetical protein